MNETTTSNPVSLLKAATNWKDNATGYHQWRIDIPECLECRRRHTFYTLHGTRADADRFAADPGQNVCDSCS